MNWYAVRGNDKRPVRFCHYWSCRPFKNEVPLPAFLIRKFYELGSKYATHVRVEVDNQAEVTGYTLCMQEDQAEREMGRWEALLKIELILHHLGWVLEREDGASMAQVEASRHDAKVAKEVARKNAMIAARAEGMKRQPAIRAEREARRAAMEKGE